jgi:hypothetical protein
MTDGFIELTRPPKRNHGAPLHFATTAHGKGKASFVMSGEVIARAGAERFDVAFNPATYQFRLRPGEGGLFPTGRSGRFSDKSGRRFLRVPLPAEIKHVQDAREPAPHEWRGSDLYVTVPMLFRKGAALPSTVSPLSAVRAVACATPPSSHREMVARAAAAVPAPKFGTRR